MPYFDNGSPTTSEGSSGREMKYFEGALPVLEVWDLVTIFVTFFKCSNYRSFKVMFCVGKNQS